jgi:hypothetical protein
MRGIETVAWMTCCRPLLRRILDLQIFLYDIYIIVFDRARRLLAGVAGTGGDAVVGTGGDALTSLSTIVA